MSWLNELDSELDKEAPNVLRIVNGELKTFDSRDLRQYLSKTAERPEITDKTPVVVLTRNHFINIVREKRLLQTEVNRLKGQLHGD